VSHQTLPGLEPALTERQSQALALIRERGPISSEELGRRLRDLRGGRSSGEQWDRSSGRGVAEALRKRSLVRQVRIEGQASWVVADWAAPIDGYDPGRAEIPF